MEGGPWGGECSCEATAAVVDDDAEPQGTIGSRDSGHVSQEHSNTSGLWEAC
jgi:hypothetical protein